MVTLTDFLLLISTMVLWSALMWSAFTSSSSSKNDYI